MPNDILHMHNTILHQEFCTFIIPKFNVNGTLCALDLSGIFPRSACGGDSGGPMICDGITLASTSINYTDKPIYSCSLFGFFFEKVNKLASCLMDLAVMLAFPMFTRTFTSIARGLKKIVAVKCICSMC